MILSITFNCDKDVALERIEKSGIRYENEPRVTMDKPDMCRYMVYHRGGNPIRWKMVKGVCRVMNAMTSEVFYEGVFPTVKA